jgi:hypothetical protein
MSAMSWPTAIAVRYGAVFSAAMVAPAALRVCGAAGFSPSRSWYWSAFILPEDRRACGHVSSPGGHGAARQCWVARLALQSAEGTVMSSRIIAS